MSKQEEIELGVVDCPVYWFTLMELGRGHGDFMQAARAKTELERLGVWVEYRPVSRGRATMSRSAGDSPGQDEK